MVRHPVVPSSIHLVWNRIIAGHPVRGTIAVAAVVLLPASATGQTTPASPTTVTPSTLAPPASPDTRALTLPETPALAPPPGSEQLRITPGKLVLEGAFASPGQEGAVLARSLEGRSVTLGDVYRVAAAIEAAYARAGFVLARVTVPPQRLVDGGPVRIIIVDGYISGIDASGVPARVRSAVVARLAGLRDRRQVRLGTIERQLLLAGEVAGVTLRSTLARGDRAGGVELILDGRWRPLAAVVRSDNMLDRSLGAANGTLQLSLNGLLGLGETIYGYAATSDPLHPFASSTQVRVFGGGLIVAPGNGRLSFNPEATISRTLPTVPAGVPRSQGRLTRYALRMADVLERTRDHRLAIDLSIEALDQRNVALDFATDIARDHYAVARLGISDARSGPREGWSVAAQIGQGLGSLGGAAAAAPTRQGATSDFTKLTAQTRATVAIGAQLILTGIAFAQSSFGRPLLRAEQFQLEGNDAVSAYVGGVTAVDEGITTRAELSTRPLPRLLGIAPYVFGASGYGGIARPTAIEPGHLGVAAFGGGARASVLGHRLELGLEYAFGFATLKALDNRQRINVTANARF